MITENEILTDVFRIVSQYMYQYTGKLYKYTRPIDSKAEDFVVALLSVGADKFIKDTNIIIRGYCSDVFVDGRYMPNTKVLEKMERCLYDISNDLCNLNGYGVSLDSRNIYSAPMLDQKIHQHMMILQIDIQNTLN